MYIDKDFSFISLFNSHKYNFYIFNDNTKIYSNFNNNFKFNFKK